MYSIGKTSSTIVNMSRIFRADSAISPKASGAASSVLSATKASPVVVGPAECPRGSQKIFREAGPCRVSSKACSSDSTASADMRHRCLSRSKGLFGNSVLSHCLTRQLLEHSNASPPIRWLSSTAQILTETRDRVAEQTLMYFEVVCNTRLSGRLRRARLIGRNHLFRESDEFKITGHRSWVKMNLISANLRACNG